MSCVDSMGPILNSPLESAYKCVNCFRKIECGLLKLDPGRQTICSETSVGYRVSIRTELEPITSQNKELALGSV